MLTPRSFKRSSCAVIPLKLPSAEKATDQYYAIQTMMDRVTILSGQYRDESVALYAIKRLSAVEIAKRNWSFVVNLLMQYALVEPDTLPVVLQVLVRYESKRYAFNKGRLKTVLNSIIKTHAPLAHSSYVAWAVWGCILFNLKIWDRNATVLSKADDCVVALLALDAVSKSLLKLTNYQLKTWRAHLNVDGLYGEHWLLAYEAQKKGWLKPKRGISKYDGDPFFTELAAHDVSFYETDSIEKYREATLNSSKRGAGGSGSQLDIYA